MADISMKPICEAIDSLAAVESIRDEGVLQRELSDLEKKISQDYYMVVVLGEFKRGKSTFVNALLGKGLLPTDVLPETATINMLLYSENPALEVVYKDGHKEKGEVTLDYLRQFSANDAGNKAESVNYIKIGYPMDVLENRVVLVDTPGVADLDDTRTDVTYGFIPQANAVIFLLDANTPLTKTEQEFIEERLVPQGINDILFIVNKYDCVDDEEDEDFLEELSKRLTSVFKLGTEEAKLKSFSLLPLSATMALQGMEQGNSKLVAASGIDEVRQHLWKTLSTGIIAERKRKYVKFRLQKIVEHIIQYMEMQVALNQAGIDELVLAEQALLEEMNGKEKHRNSIDSYATSIQDAIFAICDKSIQTFDNKLREDIMEQIDLYQGSDFKDFIEIHIARRIQKNVENWLVVYTPQINTLIKTLEQEIAMGLQQEFNQRIQLKANSHGELKPLVKSLQLSVMDISNAGLQAGAIAAVGGIGLLAIAGSTIMPLISFAALPYLRSYFHKKKLNEAKQEVKTLINQQLNKVRHQLLKDVHEYVVGQCQMVKKNTDCAYGILLEQLRQEISMQIKEKQSVCADKNLRIENLRKDIANVKNIIASVGG